jgi:hypothetical protein
MQKRISLFTVDGMDKEHDQLDRRFADLRAGIRDDLDLAKHDILERLREIETSVDLIARELAAGRSAGQEGTRPKVT